MDNIVKTMADIIGTIEGIAFQTNILALNAAVESARAGEQGRGFAVVASEVQALAQRSAVAAKEIHELINAASAQVEAGVHRVREAGGTLGEVVGSVQRVASLADHICSTAQEQSGCIAQINEAVAHIDAATQQNAALVEQTAAACEALKRRAGTLVRAVQAFRVAA
ncbi:methyl-accepting chemotaxis protein [Azohydromonas lata]|uniref:Methyl-accepting chemotaxis protein n=1 Tax=Azohydromonas lata TaxID=45677 RepID=A0ABU5IMB7_9BURK|nr:methyl-accepting chemotaxis protein [Azohydromonas lata]MDZ5460053.1 methyl-accepting chemotaxis protein [Azohydromonas lata]